MSMQPGERIKNVHCTKDSLSVDLLDGRTISAPLAWYPRLLHATTAQRAKWQIAGGGYGIHWPEIDEDLSVEGLLRGLPAPQSFYVGNSANFDEEIKMTRSNKKLMKFLDQRGEQAKKGKLIPMAEVEKRLGLKKRNKR